MGDDNEFLESITGQYGAMEAAVGQGMYQSQVEANNAHAKMLDEQTRLMEKQVSAFVQLNMSRASINETISWFIGVSALMVLLYGGFFLVHLIGEWF